MKEAVVNPFHAEIAAVASATEQVTKNPGKSGVCEGLPFLAIPHVGGIGLEPTTSTV